MTEVAKISFEQGFVDVDRRCPEWLALRLVSAYLVIGTHCHHHKLSNDVLSWHVLTVQKEKSLFWLKIEFQEIGLHHIQNNRGF